MNKILFYLSYYSDYGGIERVTTIITSALNKRGYDISILTHKYKDLKVALNGVTIYQMPNDTVWECSENYQYAEEVVSKNNFDTIVYQDSYAPNENIVCHIAKKFNIKLLVFEHNSPLYIYNKRGLDPITTVKGFLRRALHPYLLYKEIQRKRKLYDACEKYILLSKYNIDEFASLTKVSDTSKLDYINNPLSLSDKDDSGVKKENAILYVGRLTKTKGVHKMLQAWKKIQTELPDWRFDIVGDGEDRKMLEELVLKDKIERVTFYGFDNPMSYYKRSKIFWMASRFEGWGMTLLESMTRGCVPIAYSSFSAIYDIIDSGENGELVEYNNADVFANKTIEIAKDEVKRKQMAICAQNKVKKFDLEEIINEWIKIL